jgi:hypothetical protein
VHLDILEDQSVEEAPMPGRFDWRWGYIDNERVMRDRAERVHEDVTEGAGTTTMTTAAAIATGVGEILQGGGGRRCGGVCRTLAAATPALLGRTRGGSVTARPTTVGAVLTASSLFWSS